MTSPLPIGATVLALRLEQGLSRDDLAERSGVTRSAIQRLESGEGGITVGTPGSGGTLERLAQALGVEVSEIVRQAEGRA